MNPSIAEQMEPMVTDLRAVMAKVNANSKAMMDALKAMMDALVNLKPRQSEQAQGLSERLTSPLPKEEPRNDDADCEAAITLIRKTRQVSISHFQRSLNWGYNRASRVLGLLQKRGIVGEKTGEMSYEIRAMPKPAAKKRSGVVRKTESKKAKGAKQALKKLR